MKAISSTKPVVVIFFNDWRVFPQGTNAGGGESSTLALAKAIRNKGYRVIACANLPEGEGEFEGIEFWNFGASYDLAKIERRLRDLPAYHCICATLVHPLLFVQQHQNCLSRVVINHAPSAHASGLEPTTVMKNIDAMICVSSAQRALLLNPDIDSSKLVVVKNGFDPEVFSYAGPEHRDWNQLIFIGRVEPPKGIHILLQAYTSLLNEFPELRLSVFGDERYWPSFSSQKKALCDQFSGLKFHGKVPQKELARHLQRAGLLVFPSISFESAGLAVVDAQASGCPVLGFGVGGVPEYLVDGVLGKVLHERTVDSLRESLRSLLRDRKMLAGMSAQGKVYGRNRPWSVVADDVIEILDGVLSRKSLMREGEQNMPPVLRCIQSCIQQPVSEVLEAHERISSRELFSDSMIDSYVAADPRGSWVPLVKGIRYEQAGEVQEATDCYMHASRICDATDWQPLFRLTLLYAESGQVAEAAESAQVLLRAQPDFHFRTELEKLVELAG